MKQLDSSLFGLLEIKDEELIQFPEGIPGFEHLHQFLIVKPDEEIPFSYLQSVDDVEICFILTNPFMFYADYELDIPNNVQEELELTDVKDVLVYSIVTVQESMNNATLNLLAPIIINASTRVAKQVVLHDTSYQTKHNLIHDKSSKQTESE